MARGYWIAFYRSISDQDALTRYAAVAGPAILSNGGRFLARGNPTQTFEAGLQLRTVVIEFESVDRALATYESPAYKAALKLLSGVVERDIRIIEGVE